MHCSFGATRVQSGRSWERRPKIRILGLKCKMDE
jgi:hypothetical protein